MEKHNRRRFLQLGAVGIGLSMAFLWEKLTLFSESISKPLVYELPFNKHKVVAFFKEFIVVNNKDKTTVFSSHCTHLGCVINKEENGRMVCPCHGSQYNLEGEAVKGPAYKPLEKLTSTLSADETHIEVVQG